MTKVLKQVKDAGMYAGVALKPKTPIETLFPYIEDKLVDQVNPERPFLKVYRIMGLLSESCV